MNDIQKALFEIYLEFDRVCQQLNIKYFAIGGTALGAKRHSGFIPWDDDMDFGMLRSDYNRFLKEAPSIIKKDYFVQTHDSDYYWFSPIMKIRSNNTTAIEHIYANLNLHQGLWIDIFPIDRVPNSKISLFFQSIFQYMCLRRFAVIESRKKTFKRVLIDILMVILMPSKRWTYKFMNRITTKYNGKAKYGYSAIPMFSMPKKNSIYPISLTDNIVRVPFEDGTMPVFSSIEDYLKIKYGDWEKIPPLESRKGGHTISHLDLSTPYYDFHGIKGGIHYDKK